MAFKLTKQIKGGVEVQDAIFRIEHVSGTKKGLHLTVRVYKDVDAVDAGKFCDEFSTYMDGAELDFSDTAPNHLKQAYTYLTGLDEYTGNVLVD